MKTVPQLRIVIAGGSGQVGRVLAQHFHCQGHSVTVLARHAQAAPGGLFHGAVVGLGTNAWGIGPKK